MLFRSPETQEVSGLPNILSESPIAVSISTSPSGMPPSPTASGTRSARFLSNSELVTSPLLTPTSEEAARRPSVRFQPDGRAVASAPDVRGQAAGVPVRPTITVQGEEDAAATRSRTMPAVFTQAERARAEDILREQPPPAS